MNPEEAQLPATESCPEPQTHSPKTLTLEETLAPQASGLTDRGPQKPQIFLECTEIDEEVDPPILTPRSPSIDTAATHVSHLSPTPSRRGQKGRRPAGKSRVKKFQGKIDSMLKIFKPVPFVPAKALDFPRHEDLLKRLGLWEFVNISFDKAPRSDLIVQLIATFKKKDRGSYVNGVKVLVNRADLARALKLPPGRKKEKALSGMDISAEKPESVESIGFLLDFVSNWVLLHDEMWIMPENVLSWHNAIREGRFESLDWAEMMWFMVEKEISQGAALETCYYASHLQCLIRSQREEFLREEVDDKDEDEDLKMIELEDRSLELSLGHENAFDGAQVSVVKEGIFGAEKRDEEDELGVAREEDRMGIQEEGCAGAGFGEVADDAAEDERGAKERGGDADFTNSEHKMIEQGETWMLNGENDAAGPFLQRCSYNTVADIDMGYGMDKKAEGDDGAEELEEEEEEEELGDDDEEEQGDERGGSFRMTDNLFHSLSSANLIQSMDNIQMPFSSGVPIRDDSCGEFLASSSRAGNHHGQGGLSFYENPNKREMDHNDELMLNNGPNKRMRTEQLDFNASIENVYLWLEKARMAREEEEQKRAASAMEEQMLMGEVQQRGIMIEALQKARAEEQQKMHHEIYRLEQELVMMAGLVEGYRKALKETNKAFAEYRARCPQLDEPLYRDVPGSGGLVLSVTELEKQRVKREEEERRTASMIMDKVKEFEAMWARKFDASLDAPDCFANRLLKIEEEMNKLKELVARRKASQEKAEEPVDENMAEEPVDENVAEEPVDENMAEEEPVDENMAEEPVDENVAEEPVNEKKAEEGKTADEEEAVEQPVDEKLAEEPADDKVAEESACLETAVESAGQGMTEESADKPENEE